MGQTLSGWFLPSSAAAAPLPKEKGGLPVGVEMWDVVIVLPHKVKKKKNKKDKEAEKNDDDEDEVGMKDVALEEEEESGTSSTKNDTFRQLVSRLARSGLEYESFFSVQGDEIFIKVRCSENRLEAQADATSFNMKLDEKLLQETMKAGVPSHGIGPIIVGTSFEGKPMSSLEPCESIYAKFDRRDELRPLYEKVTGLDVAFRSMHRIKLVTNILQASRRLGGCDIPLDKRIAQGKLLAYMPLHDPVERTHVQRRWMNAALSRLPYDDLRNYLGEALALYARFLGFLTHALAVLGLPGTLVSAAMWGLGYGSIASGVLRAVYAVVLVVWSAVTVAEWHRIQHATALKWGMTNFERSEPTRPQYKGHLVKSPVDGQEEKYFPPSRRRIRLARGFLISAVIVVVDFVFVFTLLRWRVAGGDETFVAFVQAVGIQIFARFYKAVAIRLTNVENWRTNTQYADALTQKLFGFNFVNSYFSLLVTIFGDSKKVCSGSDSSSCLALLELDLVIIFLVAIGSNTVFDTIVPILTRTYNRIIEGGFTTKLSNAEWQ